MTAMMETPDEDEALDDRDNASGDADESPAAAEPTQTGTPVSMPGRSANIGHT